MTKPDGVHHVALSTADMKGQLEFFTGVLGLELVALFWMHGVKGAWHSFLKLNERSFVSFVHMPAMAGIKGDVGVTHAGNPGGVSAPGTLQHLSLRVETPAAMTAMRDRIRSHGIAVFGELDHGMCRSIYFAGPENLVLEIACEGDLGVEPSMWIDPEVVKEAGISQEELARMISPPSFQAPGEPVAQPEHDPSKPFLDYPAHVYARLLATPDAKYTAAWSRPKAPMDASA